MDAIEAAKLQTTLFKILFLVYTVSSFVLFVILEKKIEKIPSPEIRTKKRWIAFGYQFILGFSFLTVAGTNAPRL